MATTTIELNKLPVIKGYNILQGDGITEAYQLKIRSEAATTYSSLTLTGATVKLYVKKGSTTVVDGTSQTVDDASAGKFTMNIAGSTTSSWAGDYIYEVEVVWPTSHTNFSVGLTKTVLAGKITVRSDI